MDLPLLDDFPEADAADDPHLLPVGEDQGAGLFHGWREVDNSDVVQALLRGHLWDELGRTSRMKWWMFSLPFLDTTSNGEEGYYYR